MVILGIMVPDIHIRTIIIRITIIVLHGILILITGITDITDIITITDTIPHITVTTTIIVRIIMVSEQFLQKMFIKEK